MTIQEYMYRTFRKAGMMIEGACVVLTQIQHEGTFKPTNAEDSKGVADELIEEPELPDDRPEDM